MRGKCDLSLANPNEMGGGGHNQHASLFVLTNFKKDNRLNE